MMPAVQEKETRESVKAMKNMPRKLLAPEIESALLTREEGRLISNTPKKEIAKMSNKKKTLRLNQPLEARPFKA